MSCVVIGKDVGVGEGISVGGATFNVFQYSP